MVSIRCLASPSSSALKTHSRHPPYPNHLNHLNHRPPSFLNLESPSVMVQLVPSCSYLKDQRASSKVLQNLSNLLILCHLTLSLSLLTLHSSRQLEMWRRKLLLLPSIRVRVRVRIRCLPFASSSLANSTLSLQSLIHIRS